MSRGRMMTGLYWAAWLWAIAGINYVYWTDGPASVLLYFALGVVAAVLVVGLKWWATRHAGGQR